MYVKKETVIFSLFVIVLLLLMNISLKQKNKMKYFVFDTHMNENNNNSKSLPGAISKSLESINITKAHTYDEADIVFTNKLDDMENLSKVHYSKKCKWIYGLRSVNMICSKSVLALIIREKNPEKHQNLIPKTYIISKKSDYDELLRSEFEKDSGKPVQHMLLKQNIQRQSGITFVKHITDITNNKDSKQNVVCQVLLSNPYIVNSRKINMRIYLLIVCDKSLNKTLAFIYNDGFMYYTKEFYSKTTVNSDTQITTGYIDRDVYKHNPLTIQDFLDQKLTKIERNNFQTNLQHLFRDVMNSYKQLLDLNEFDKGPNHFVILGCDIAPDENLNIKLLEINKGPDLSFKDERDGQLKYQMIKNAMDAITTHNYGSINNYTQVL